MNPKIISLILSRLLGSSYEGGEHSHSSHRYPRLKPHVLAGLRKDIGFLILAGVIILFFIGSALFELFFTTPLSRLFADVWNTVLQTSPENIVNLPNQIPQNNSLMNKTVGDWLNSIPNLWQPILSIIAAPVDAIIGIILVVLAVILRIGKRITSYVPRLSRFGDFSWTTLGLSFSPLLLDYFVF